MRKKLDTGTTVDGLKLDRLAPVTVREAQMADDQRAAVGNGDPASHAGGAERLAALQHPEKRFAGAIVEPEQADELREDLVLAGGAQVERHRFGGEEIDELHGGGNLHPPRWSVKAGA